MADVSVVMSVYDEPLHVQKTIDSVLAQKGVEFEFIIISDGATDDVVSVVKRYSSDPRIRLIEQENKGLTKALINGCRQTKAPFIARIDAGDEMLPARLLKQRQQLQSNPDLGFVSCWVQLQTEEAYPLYGIELSTEKLTAGLTAQQVDKFCTPFHASVMFRKSVYFEVGEYRAEFYFTQDADLWSRMIEVSRVHVIEEYLTSGIFSENGISGRNAKRQRRIAELIVAAKRLRKAGESEKPILDQVYQIRPGKDLTVGKQNNFDGLYFIANVLSGNGSEHAGEYWLKAFKAQPLNVKLWFSYLRSLIA